MSCGKETDLEDGMVLVCACVRVYEREITYASEPSQRNGLGVGAGSMRMIPLIYT